MISIQAARRIVLEQASPLTDSERVPVVDAVGRVLAADVAADGDLPPFDRVMMDGFAVRAAETVGDAPELEVAAEVAAGDEANQPLESGQAHEIMTGAPLPPGADAVVPVEWTERVGSRVRLSQAVRSGQHVAPRGEDLHRGQVIAAAGECVSTLGLSLLIASGAGEVAVRRRPHVALLTSGDELVPPGAPVRRGQIRESNGPALRSLLGATGARVENLGVARDTLDDLTAKFQRALEADVVVLTGGSSVGWYDLSADVVEAAGGQRHFDRLSVKPGKPTLFYTLRDRLVFCLPGNPVAALMTGRILVAPAIARLAGRDVCDWTGLRLPLEAAVRRNPARDLLIPMRTRTEADGTRRLVFDGWHGSGDLVCMARAQGFGFVGSGEGELAAGESADWFDLPRPGTTETGW